MSEQRDYDTYNREERYVCAHLFRLLHEPANDYEALRRFLKADPATANRAAGDFRIYAEVALIRDAYHHRHQSPASFMDDLVRIVVSQEGVQTCRLYSELPAPLQTPSQTHPGQIRRKAGTELTSDEGRVYGAIQGMFNAKPDLVICTDGALHVYEAKLTSGFDDLQFARTCNIAQVWAELLFPDLGYQSVPEVRVKALGLAQFLPYERWEHVSWEEVLEIAEDTYPEHDRTRRVLERAVKLSGGVV